jgi:nucleoside-diphosphate-sugar epimerase
MRVFVTGATGFIGSAVVRELIGAGHTVIGLARSEASANALLAAGAAVHRGSIEDIDSLRSGAAKADGAVHAAFFHDFTHASISTRIKVMFGGAPKGIVSRFMRTAVETDRRAIETIGNALEGSDRTLVAAFATMAMTPGRLATEDDAYDKNAVGGPRGKSEETMLELASRGIRTSVVRLPPVVHGADDRSGFAPRLIETARKQGFSAYVGDGRNRWPAVHRLDAARLFRLALEKGSAGAKYHAVAEEGIPFLEISELIGRRLGLPVVAKTPEEAAKLFSWLAPFVTADNPASSASTQERLGWEPTNASLLDDLDQPHYFK